MIKYFKEDLIALSKDRVVNVRIKLAEAFNDLHKEYLNLITQMNNKKLDVKRKQSLQDIKLKLDKYLNRNFYIILKNLKLDTNE